ncbi:MAG TPA: cyclic pyranopterin monophosphate synthase MoaC [Candidatus Moranbacteria bacterium]|nr:cyclic pyranopterin monophosphate synthase MoaC [Candidatus Moranbacteria bacterium]
MKPVIIDLIAAQSGTGKTTVLVKLLPELKARGLKVAALKGEVRRYDLDVPGKDTWRFAEAGAAVTGMITPDKYIFIGSAPAEGINATASARLPDMDLVIIEGKRRSPFPKIEILRSAVNRQPLLPEGVIAIVTDLEELPLPRPLPLFRLDDPAGLARFIDERFFRSGKAAEPELTHLDKAGRPRMVDVSGKKSTHREAYAAGEIAIAPQTLVRIREGTMKKGDILAVAQVAAIMAVKDTGRLIPLAHPLNISGVDVDFKLNERESKIEIGVRVKLTGQTGVEMEALTGVSAAALTIYDMCKAIDKNMLIGNIRLLEKKGGRSGSYRREENEDG